MDAYFENLIDRAERDRRLEVLEADGELYGNVIARAASVAPTLTARQLASAFAVFREFEFLGRTDKRSLLRATTPEIHIQDYRIVGLRLLADSASRDEVSPTGRDSSQRRA